MPVMGVATCSYATALLLTTNSHLKGLIHNQNWKCLKVRQPQHCRVCALISRQPPKLALILAKRILGKIKPRCTTETAKIKTCLLLTVFHLYTSTTFARALISCYKLSTKWNHMYQQVNTPWGPRVSQATVAINSKQSGYHGAGMCHAVEFTSRWPCTDNTQWRFSGLDLTLSATVDCTAICKQLIDSKVTIRDQLPIIPELHWT